MSTDTLTVPCLGVLDSLVSGRKAKPHVATASRRDGGWSVACSSCGYQARQTTAEAADLDKLAGVQP